MGNNKYCPIETILGNIKLQPTRGLSAMLAVKYILIDISLLSFSPNFANVTELWNILSAFYLYSTTVPS